MHVQIIEGYQSPEKRTFKGKDGQPDVDRFTQKGFIEVGQPFPIQFSIPIDSLAQAYSVGHYELSPTCLETDKYGKLLVNPYKMILTPQKNKPQ